MGGGVQKRAEVEEPHTRHWGLAPLARKASAVERGERDTYCPPYRLEGLAEGEQGNATQVARRWPVWPQLEHRAGLKWERSGGRGNCLGNCRVKGVGTVRSMVSSKMSWAPLVLAKLCDSSSARTKVPAFWVSNK